jgi:hypothetical protein
MTTTQIDLESLVQLSLEGSVEQATFLSFDTTGLLERFPLTNEDPVASLLGRTVDQNIAAVGICAPATAMSANDETLDVDQTVVHIVHRNGMAITVLSHQSHTRTFGPTSEPQRGRVPDACRRILGITTSPPTDSMTDFVIAAWLEVIVRQALQTPELSWADIVRLHPAGTAVGDCPTPVAVADATKALGRALDWERFRKVIATVGGFPFGDTAKETAAWMDTGMFSRWAMELLPSCSDAFDLLESVLGPATFDRLWATIRFCE